MILFSSKRCVIFYIVVHCTVMVITTNVVRSNPAHVEVYSIHHSDKVCQ